MTTDEALIPASEVPGPVLAPLLPRGFAPGSTAQIVDGVPTWFTFHGDDCDFNDLYVHTHDCYAPSAAAPRSGTMATAPPRHADSVPVPGAVHGRDDTQVMPAVGEQERRAS